MSVAPGVMVAYRVITSSPPYEKVVLSGRIFAFTSVFSRLHFHITIVS